MSHHTHVFLSNEETAQDAMSYVNSYLDTEVLYSNRVDSYDIIGVLNLTTGEYTNNEYAYREYKEEPTTIEKLEEYANSLFSKEQYTYLENELKRHILNCHFFNASEVCKRLDGIVYAVRDGHRWTAKDPFPINNEYIDIPGITDLLQMINPIRKVDLYAVLVDFHS